MKYADALWSIIIRASGKCALAGLDHIHCSGALQGMHIIGRTNYDLRHELANGLPGCQAHHTYYTYRQKEWTDFVLDNFPAAWNFLTPLPKTMKRDYRAIAEGLEGILVGLVDAGQLKHKYKGLDKQIINKLTDRGRHEIDRAFFT